MPWPWPARGSAARERRIRDPLEGLLAPTSILCHTEVRHCRGHCVAEHAKLALSSYAVAASVRAFGCHPEGHDLVCHCWRACAVGTHHLCTYTQTVACSTAQVLRVPTGQVTQSTVIIPMDSMYAWPRSTHGRPGMRLIFPRVLCCICYRGVQKEFSSVFVLLLGPIQAW